MRNSFINAISPWVSQMNRSRHWLAGLSLSVGLLGAALLPTVSPAIAAAEVAPKPQAAAKQVLPDGVYLYGQSAQPDQIGQGYFVFEAKQGQVVGALYMPRSSFDCTSGKFQGDQLSLRVVNSYDRTANPFEIALEKTSNVAAQGNPAFQDIGLQGFQRLSKVSENDYRMLKVCKADLQKQAKK
ncbi:hypothetical protein [Stenomitos frigidus]|uniref:Uncharacterized protein n=1 Tax=Stenomitos frigidus ULC18 TaxID=2107698 RepID=A0A2T1E0Z6_9CYAN|nr:hypothetical protein [Stenomitos frigidus]PSB26371.1 hypothetical protein C7B82_19860 [Stenomitos frigidus ULC18]